MKVFLVTREDNSQPMFVSASSSLEAVELYVQVLGIHDYEVPKVYAVPAASAEAGVHDTVDIEPSA